MTLAYLDLNQCDRIHLVFSSDVFSKKKQFLNECLTASINNEIYSVIHRVNMTSTLPSFPCDLYNSLSYVYLQFDLNFTKIFNPSNQSGAWGMNTPLPRGHSDLHISHLFSFFKNLMPIFIFFCWEHSGFRFISYKIKRFRLYELFLKITFNRKTLFLIQVTIHYR